MKTKHGGHLRLRVRFAKQIEVSSLYVLVLLSVILFGCRPATPPPPPSDRTPTASIHVSETATAAQPTAVPQEALKVRNAQYQLGATDALKIVQLKDGKYQQGTVGGTDFISVQMTNFAAVGDLNADGKNEIAALVSENYGGTGTFVFLAVYSEENGTPAFQTSTMVDDRPQLNALSIDKGEIFLDAVVHGPDDPMCCPTLRTTRHYRLVDNQLDMADYATFTTDGKPRAIEIEAPTDGTQIFSSIPIKGQVAIPPSTNNLTYRIYDVSGIELSAGDLPVHASDAGGTGTFDALIPLGKVLSGTIIQVQVQDHDPANDSLLAMDSVELVVK